MVRTPCCDKMGVKRGPWSPEEDRILINFIERYGCGNWRALPKQAGLMRCGKSCRLRWLNYLRPDVKRGNLTPQEEETIITLHNALGNKWSVIASHLPGRTDNEIKNLWNTHLKKRVNNGIHSTTHSIPNKEYHIQALNYESKSSCILESCQGSDSSSKSSCILERSSSENQDDGLHADSLKENDVAKNWVYDEGNDKLFNQEYSFDLDVLDYSFDEILPPLVG